MSTARSCVCTVGGLHQTLRPWHYIGPGCRFQPRHNSSDDAEIADMVKITGFATMDALIDATVPKSIRRTDGMDLGIYNEGFTESKFLEYFKWVSDGCAWQPANVTPKACARSIAHCM